MDASRLTLPKTVRYWHWGLLLPVIVLSILGVGRFRSGSAIAEETVTPLPVQTQVLDLVNGYSVERTYTGTLVARRSSDLGFEQAGTLIEVLVDEGDTVSQGMPLARLDTRSLMAQRQQLEAQRRQAQAQLEELQRGPRPEDIAAATAVVNDLQAQLDLARLQQTRREDLYTQGAISLEERDQAVFGASALTSRLSQAQSQLEELQAGTRVEQVTAQDAQVAQIDARIQQIEITLTKSLIKAPFAGRVSRRWLDEGGVVGPGQTVLRLVENSDLEARIGIPSQSASRLSLGSEQTVEIDGQMYRGQVTALLPELDDASQTVTAVVTLPATATEASLTVGAIARLTLQEQQPETGYWLPTSALVAGERGLWSAYVLGAPAESTPENPDNHYQVVRRDVEVLHTAGDQAFVRGLLQPGDAMITSGTHRLVPGQIVQN